MTFLHDKNVPVNLRKEFRGTLESLPLIAGFVRGFLEQCGLDNVRGRSLELAVDEAASNIIKHAYRSQDGRILIEAEALDHQIQIRITDSGPEFDPTATPPINVNELLDCTPPAGLGIYLMRHFTDTIEYLREGQKNITSLIWNSGKLFK